MTKFTDWYVIYAGGNGLRILSKPTGSSVHGGAGSTSQMVNAKPRSYERRTIDKIQVIRFTKAWAHYHEHLLSISFTLDEYKKWKSDKKHGPDQTKITDYF